MAGVEFSADYKDKELHILALGVRPEHFARISELMEGICRRKEQSNVELVEALARAGYVVDYEKIKASKGGKYINRAHIAAELVAEGYVGSIKEAFVRLLAKGGGFYKEPERIQAFEIIEFIKGIGAVAILAHPFLSLEEEELYEFLPQAKMHGLDGIETLYSEYSPETVALSQAIARQYGLLESGGSDFHGGNRPHVSMGVGRGTLRVPSRIADDIIALANNDIHK